jgi:hypothetical protein
MPAPPTFTDYGSNERLWITPPAETGLFLPLWLN